MHSNFTLSFRGNPCSCEPATSVTESSYLTAMFSVNRMSSVAGVKLDSSVMMGKINSD